MLARRTTRPRSLVEASCFVLSVAAATASSAGALAGEPIVLSDEAMDAATAGVLDNFSLTVVAPITVITNIVNSTAIGIGAENVSSEANGIVTGGNQTDVTAGLSLGPGTQLSDAGAAGMLDNTSLTIVVPITVITNEVNSTALGLSSTEVGSAALGAATAGNTTDVLDLLGI